MRDKILRLCSRFVCKYPKLIIIFFSVLAFLSIASAIINIKISTNYDALRSENLDYVKEYHKVKENFGDNDFLLIVIEASDNKEKAKEIAGVITDKLKNLPSAKKVFHKVDIEFFKKNALLFLKNEDYNTIKSFIHSSKLEISKLGQINNINSFLKYFISRLSSPNVTSTDTMLLYYFIKEFSLSFEKDNEHSVIKDIVDKKIQELEESAYFFSDSKKLLFILVLTEKNYSSIDLMEEPLKDIRDIVSSVKQEYKDIPIGITGQPVIQSDEMSLTSKETSYAVIISIILVSLVFILSLKNISRPFLAITSLVISIIITFGIASLYPGRLTILSIVFSVMMVGLGIDFSIHIISRYHEELAHGHSIFKAIENTLLKAGKSNLSAIIASVVAFYAALFVDFQGIRELGFIAGTGIIIILFATLLLLPSLLIVYDKNRVKLEASSFTRFYFLEKVIKYPRAVVIITIIITLAFLAFIFFKGAPKFNNNLMELQAHGIESVVYEMKLISNSDGSSWLSTMLVSDSLEESDKLVSELAQRDTVGKIESLRDYIPDKQDESVERLVPLKKDLLWLMNRVKRQPKRTSIRSLRKDIKRLKELFVLYREQNKDSSTGGGLEGLFIDIDSELPSSLDSVYNQLGSAKAIDKVHNFQDNFFADIYNAFSTIGVFLNPSTITIDKLPSLIKYRFVGKDGKIVSYVSPRNNIWLGNELEKYVLDLRLVSPNVVGSAVNFYEDTKRMKDGFTKITIYVLIIVFILLIADFRSFILSFIALIPLMIGMTWLLGIMSLGNIYFNIANSFSIPLLIGISIAYGIHVVHRFIEEGDARFITKSTGTAVILTAITTIIGFASLLIATHRGTFTLGLVMSIGIASSLITSMVFLPALLELLKKKITK